jgi:integrase/recombinase XerD
VIEAVLAPLPGGYTRPQLLKRVAAFYAKRLRESALPIGWLDSRGLGQPLLWDAFHLGWADGTLKDTIPRQGPLWDALVELGVFTPLGTERLEGCLVVPLSHPDDGLVGLYGWRIGSNPGYRNRRCYLPGTEYGVFNWHVLKSEPTLLVTANVLDALAVWRAGVRGVSTLLDFHYLPPGLDQLLQRYHTAQVRLCLADRAHAPIVEQLAQRRIASRVVTLPAEASASQVLLEAGPQPLRAALQADEALDLALWRARFQKHMQSRQWSDRTIEEYTLVLRRFFDFLASQSVTSIPDITRETMDAYRLYLFQSPWRDVRLAPRSQASGLSAAKAFTRFLAQERYVLVDPGQGVVGPRLPRGLPRTLLSVAEVETFMASTNLPTALGIRNRAMLEVFYSTAIRNNELRRLRIDDVALDRRLLTVRYGKGRKARLLPLGSEALKWLYRWLKQGRPRCQRYPDEASLFLTQRGRALSRDIVVWIVARAGRQAGLSIRVTPHLLRHCCATHMLANGAGLRHIQELLGHESPETTQRYAQVELSDLRAVHQRCHPRERGTP